METRCPEISQLLEKLEQRWLRLEFVDLSDVGLWPVHGLSAGVGL